MIPKGQYSGGIVVVWDQGWYDTIAPNDARADQEKFLPEELGKGSVKIKINGRKVNGEFALVKTKGIGPNAWLLITH
ncbi:hypothetical protein DRW42_13280 [Pedobacter miscanthi]|uniref:DNA ligase D 3'-phosphoesterase domain-containing protein n=1 Tax=Pedobacter miscanthi TaxID=2259170 RepID=A0A366KYX4_9SPHI|nr:hypothetical protein DRW42_13280 [Pedobacter miscanthi]